MIWFDRYPRHKVIEGSVYNGADRHNGEVAAFHLSRLLNMTMVPVSVGRRLSLKRDILPVASHKLSKTFFMRGRPEKSAPPQPYPDKYNMTVYIKKKKLVWFIKLLKWLAIIKKLFEIRANLKPCMLFIIKEPANDFCRLIIINIIK